MSLCQNVLDLNINFDWITNTSCYYLPSALHLALIHTFVTMSITVVMSGSFATAALLFLFSSDIVIPFGDQIRSLKVLRKHMYTVVQRRISVYGSVYLTTEAYIRTLPMRYYLDLLKIIARYEVIIAWCEIIITLYAISKRNNAIIITRNAITNFQRVISTRD